MPIIQYAKAFNALDNYVEYYNSTTTSLSAQIRQAMILTTREIIKVYSLSLLKANSIAPLDFQNLPPLRTNNVQLARRANASTRTIQRHISRLREANIIIAKNWRGSKADYELFINPDILLVTGKKAVNSTKTAPKELLNLNTENQSFKKLQTPTCPHTDTSNNGYINNIIIAVDKLKTDASSLPLTKHNSSRNATGNTLTGYTGKTAPKKNNDAGETARNKRATKQTGAEISETDVARSASLSLYINALWMLARNTLYKDHYLTQSQEKRAKELLRLWYDPVPEKMMSKVHQIYVERIAMVEKYIAKDSERRYVQLPHQYFDPKNPSGFTGTRKWYKKQKLRELEVQQKLILHAQIRRFLNNEKKDTSKQKPRLELYKACETRIGKLGNPELLQTFHAAVLNRNAHSYLQFNT